MIKALHCGGLIFGVNNMKTIEFLEDGRWADPINPRIAQIDAKVGDHAIVSDELAEIAIDCGKAKLIVEKETADDKKKKAADKKAEALKNKAKADKANAQKNPAKSDKAKAEK